MGNHNELIEEMLKQVNESLSSITEDKSLTDLSTDYGLLETDLSFENKVFFDLDRLIEEAIRIQLKESVIEDKETDALKLEGVLAVDELEIGEDKLKEFTETTLHPILESLGIFKFDFENKDPKIVDGSIYETALAIQLAKDGEFDAIRDLLDKSIEISEGEKIEGELTNEQLLEKYIGTIHSEWGLDESESELVFENAKHIVETGKTDTMIMDINQATMVFSEAKDPYQSMNAAGTSARTVGEKVADAARMVKHKAKGAISAIANAAYRARMGLANFFKSHGYAGMADKLKAVKGSHLALGAAVLGLIAAVIWKKTRNKNKVVSALRAQQGKCKLTSNPEKCKAVLNKQIAKWSVVKEEVEIEPKEEDVPKNK